MYAADPSCHPAFSQGLKYSVGLLTDSARNAAAYLFICFFILLHLETSSHWWILQDAEALLLLLLAGWLTMQFCSLRMCFAGTLVVLANLIVLLALIQLLSLAETRHWGLGVPAVGWTTGDISWIDNMHIPVLALQL